MNSKALKILEFDKILNRLSGYAVSEEAKEMCQNLVPKTVYEAVVSDLNDTSEAEAMMNRCSSPSLASLKNINGILKRAEIGSVLTIPELISTAKVMQSARVLKSYAASDKNEAENGLKRYFSRLVSDKIFETTIFSNLLGENEVADNASPELSAIRRQIRRGNDKIRDILNDMIRSARYSKCLQDSIVSMRDDRFVIPVKAEYKGEISGIIHDTSSSGSTLFIEPSAVVDESNKLRELAGKESEEIEKILTEYTVMVNNISEILQQNYYNIINLDFVFAKAKLSAAMNASMPLISSDNHINIKKGRHPLLDSKTVVPVDVRLGDDFDALIITGPNTGGKTVVLKTIGLFTLMAQSGLNIPALSGSTLRIYENVFADIGDEQSIEQSLSTFSSHMKNIVYITKHVNSNTLVLFDELGAGTDPVEGAALAIAIIENARQSGATVAATTHYSELKLYALSTPGVKNASCEFDVATLKPTYKLLIGIPGKSNAFAISSKLGLPKHIVDAANAQISEDNVKFEDVLSDLERKQRQIDADAEKIAQLRHEIETIKKSVSHEKTKISAKADQIIEKARAEAKKLLLEAKQESDDILSEIQKIKRNANKVTQKDVAEIKTKLNKKLSDVQKVNVPKKKGGVNRNEIKIGSTIEVIELGQPGTILTLPKKNDNKVTVQVGLMKMHLTLDEIALTEAPKPENPERYISNRHSGLRTVSASTELDLRGYMLEDAIMATEKFIDDAILSSLNLVTIIHGKGTGVLRSGIQQMLKNDKRVKSFRLGKYGEGESGVTVVEL